MAVLSIVPPGTPPALPSSDVDPTSPPSPTSSSAATVDFGNPETLAQIRSLTDVGTMTRLLHECIAYQRSLDLRLDSLLSSRPDLDRHLLSLRRSSAPLLSLARSDSSLLLSSLSSTSSLADAVSSKVRLLDLAQSRVHLVLSRIDAALHRSHCLDSARNSLDIEDYASAAASVHSFLQIDSQFPSSSASDQKQQLLELKSKLESIVKSKLAAAVDRKDHPAILRFAEGSPEAGGGGGDRRHHHYVAKAPSSAAAAASKGKSCKGCLYYSSVLKSNGRNPRCVGITRTLPQVPLHLVGESEVEANNDGRSLADFKYACVGYSVFLDKKDNPNDKGENRAELPFCAGIELLVDRRATASSHVPAHAHNKEDGAVRPQPRPQKPAHSPGHSPGDEFFTRFTRNAGLVASGVARNLNKVGIYIKDTLDDMMYPYRRRPK